MVNFGISELNEVSYIGTAGKHAIFTVGTAAANVKPFKVSLIDFNFNNAQGTANTISIYQQLGTASPTNRINFKLAANSTIHIAKQIPYRINFTGTSGKVTYIYASTLVKGTSAPNIDVSGYLE